MKQLLHSFFKSHGIKYYRALPLDTLDGSFIISPRRLPENARSAVAFLIPYSCGDSGSVSKYAIPRDYHLFADELEKDLMAAVEQSGISAEAEVFADTSPFAEAQLASLAQLGFIGKNGLIINPEYGSYVFLGEVVTDAVLDDFYGAPPVTTAHCANCGACVAACPGKCLGNFTCPSSDNGICYSALSQKKRLTEDEEKLLSHHNLIWGCDICQDVCPHNKNAAPTPIGFFRTHRLANVCLDTLEAMSDEEFSQRAYAWRGRQVITRNAALLNIITDSDAKINKEST